MHGLRRGLARAESMDNPTTDVVRHWVAWGPSENCPDELIEHSNLRVLQFEAWLAEVKADAWDKGQLSWYETGRGMPNPYRQVEEQ